ncbi:MAG: electron transport protein SCO1/SenC [Bryobacterales bacterium]|nr:electron transport protein SCO1/SenC [Bryobacterales bacterium]
MLITMRFLCLLAALCVSAGAASRYEGRGLVVAADPEHHTLTISHEAIPGYMDAMAMPFEVRGRSLPPGTNVTFTLVVEQRRSWIENVREAPFASAERDPSLAKRLELIDRVTGTVPVAVKPGEVVPDFKLTDQAGKAVSLAALLGKVVAVTFVYTRCPLPDYCLRLSNNFDRLSKRFPTSELVLLTISFDPVHDTADKLAQYGGIWKADAARWHFLTGAPKEIERVTGLFGVTAWKDDGLLTHSLHTAIIGRDGRLVANLEGNKFSAKQLGDLVEKTLSR